MWILFLRAFVEPKYFHTCICAIKASSEGQDRLIIHFWTFSWCFTTKHVHLGCTGNGCMIPGGVCTLWTKIEFYVSGLISNKVLFSSYLITEAIIFSKTYTVLGCTISRRAYYISKTVSQWSRRAFLLLLIK